MSILQIRLYNSVSPETLEAEITGALGKMWAYMGFPATPKVFVLPDREDSDLFDFALFWDGVRLPAQIYPQKAKPEELAGRILAAVFESRSRLATAEVLRFVRERIGSNYSDTPLWFNAPAADWMAVAQRLLSCGYSLDRLENCMRHWTPDYNLPAALMEKGVGAFQDVKIQASYRAPFTEENLKEIFSRIYSEAYYSWGIYLPSVKITPLEEDAGINLQLSFNDFEMPMPPGIGLQDLENTLYGLLKKCASWFVNESIIDSLLIKLEDTHRSLFSMIRDRWPLWRLVNIFRILLSESVNVRNLSEILEVLLRIEVIAADETNHVVIPAPVQRLVVAPPGTENKEIRDEQYADQVRASLNYALAYPYLTNGMMECYTLDEQISNDFRDGFFADQPAITGTRFYEILLSAHGSFSSASQRVLLCTSSIRSEVARSLRPYFPDLAVLAYTELPVYYQVQSLGRIG